MNESHTCANCGATLTGPYCAQCGQSALDSTVAFGGWLRETAGETLALEGRTLRTARDFFHPGRLSIDWAAGRRARHLSPVRIFLLASLIFFSVAFLLGPLSPAAGARAFNDAAVAAVARRTATEIVVLSVPVVALTLALVLYRKRRGFIEHLVFALHAVSVGLVMLAVTWALAHSFGAMQLGGLRLGGVALIVCGLFTYAWVGVAVRRFYATRRVTAVAVVVAIVLALGLVARPFARFADSRLEAYDRRMDERSRARGVAAYAAWQRADLPPELRRAAAAQAYGAYLELDQREALTVEDRPRFACLALELGMPGQAAAIDSAAVARCPTGL